MARAMLPRRRRRDERRQGDSRRHVGRCPRDRRSRRSSSRRRSPGWAEQDPEAWWAGERRRRSARCSPRAPARASGRSRHLRTDALVGLSRRARRGDSAGAALVRRPHDRRVPRDHRARRRRGSGCAISRRNPALEGFTLPKVLWLRNHEPEAFARLATVMLREGLHSLSSSPASLATEPSDASATLMYDTARLRWSTEILDAVGLAARDRARRRRVVGDTRPSVTSEAAGAPDCGRARRSSAAARTTRAARPASARSRRAKRSRAGGRRAPCSRRLSEPRVDPTLRAHTFCHVVPGVWYLMGVVLSAGGAFAWYRDQLARDLTSTGEANERLNAEATAIPPGAEGVTFLPYLQGERTPHRDASARGAILGLSLAHSRAHVTRAVVEGVCFALRDSVTILQELGVVPNHMLLTGGGATRCVSCGGCSATCSAFRCARSIARRGRRTAPRSSRPSARARFRISPRPQRATLQRGARRAAGARGPRGVRRAIPPIPRVLPRRAYGRRFKALIRLPRPRHMRRVLRHLLGLQEAGLVLVLVALAIALTVLAGSHVDPLSGHTVNNFWNSYTLIQTATDATLLRHHGDRRDGRHHLRRHRSLGRLDLRAVRSVDGAAPARAGSDEPRDDDDRRARDVCGRRSR